MVHCHSGLDPESPEGFEILKQVQDDILGVQDDNIGVQCNTKISYLEKLELRKLEVRIGMLCMLANFFDKRIKIELVD